jgi:hypothetical protein
VAADVPPAASSAFSAANYTHWTHAAMPLMVAEDALVYMYKLPAPGRLESYSDPCAVTAIYKQASSDEATAAHFYVRVVQMDDGFYLELLAGVNATQQHANTSSTNNTMGDMGNSSSSSSLSYYWLRGVAKFLSAVPTTALEPSSHNATHHNGTDAGAADDEQPCQPSAPPPGAVAAVLLLNAGGPAMCGYAADDQVRDWEPGCE